MENKKIHPLLTLPSAIILAGAMIAIAIIWSQKPANTNVATDTQQAKKQVSVKPVTKQDHIFGNPDAEIKIVEYSDPSCPFCKSFHPTMEKIMEEYGPSGQVAWVYRHFPLDTPREDGSVLHPHANKEAQAFECANELGGNEMFWKYANRLYEVTPSVTGATPNGLDPKQLPEIAKYVGLDVTAFNTCLDSNKYNDKVKQQFLDGVNAGVTGTPYSFIIPKSGEIIPISGAQPYTEVKKYLDILLKK